MLCLSKPAVFHKFYLVHSSVPWPIYFGGYKLTLALTYFFLSYFFNTSNRLSFSLHHILNFRLLKAMVCSEKWALVERLLKLLQFHKSPEFLVFKTNFFFNQVRVFCCFAADLQILDMQWLQFCLSSTVNTKSFPTDITSAVSCSTKIYD